MAQLALRESQMVLGKPPGAPGSLRSYDITGLPPGHSAIVRQLPAGGWKLMVAEPGKTLEDLRYDEGVAWPAVPPTLHIVHVVGFPLERDLAHPWAPRAYKRLAPLGPNDGGGILLADCEKLTGTVCPLLGADHYLSPRWDALPLLTGVIAAAVAPRQANQCEIPPTIPPDSKSSE